MDEQTLHNVRTRAWLLFSGLMLVRLSYIILNDVGIFDEKVECDENTTEACYGKYNEELLDPLQTSVGYIVRAITCFSLI